MHMAHKSLWEHARTKNPLVKRNAMVRFKGRDYRVANVESGGNVVLRDEKLVHPSDINPVIPRKEQTVKIAIDWADAYGWKCAFCGGDIDHLHSEKGDGYTDDAYNCQEQNGPMCDQTYFMVRWSHSRRAPNGDALTLMRWMEVEAEDEYIVDLSDVL